jgi:hypothetical protein
MPGDLLCRWVLSDPLKRWKLVSTLPPSGSVWCTLTTTWEPDTAAGALAVPHALCGLSICGAVGAFGGVLYCT